MKLDKSDIITGLVVAVIVWMGSTLWNNSHNITKLDTEISHINETVNDIKDYWTQWSQQQGN